MALDVVLYRLNSYDELKLKKVTRKINKKAFNKICYLSYFGFCEVFGDEHICRFDTSWKQL
jgi:hypothetical protein